MAAKPKTAKMKAPSIRVTKICDATDPLPPGYTYVEEPGTRYRKLLEGQKARNHPNG